MLCVYCKALDAELCFFHNKRRAYACDELCLEGVLNEEWLKATRLAKQRKAEYFQVGHDSEGRY